MATRDPNSGRFVAESFEDRLWARVNATANCWEWTGALSTDGYGRIGLGPRGQYKMAHRAVYESVVGPIPDGLTLDHLCRNRACVNPDHLEPVELAENLRRAPNQISTINANKTHCVNGHKFDSHNTYLRKDRPRRRECRACRRVTVKRFAERQLVSGGASSL